MGIIVGLVRAKILADSAPFSHDFRHVGKVRTHVQPECTGGTGARSRKETQRRGVGEGKEDRRRKETQSRGGKGQIDGSHSKSRQRSICHEGGCEHGGGNEARRAREEVFHAREEFLRFLKRSAWDR